MLSLLPPEGNLTTLRITRDLQIALSFSEDELAALAFTNKNDAGVEDGNTHWVRDAGKPKEIPVGPKVLDVIRESIKKLDQRSQLRMGQLAVVERLLTEESAKAESGPRAIDG